MVDCISLENTLEGWKDFTEIMNNNLQKRTITIESWNRCKELGLKPENLKFKFLTNEEIESKIKVNNQLIQASKKYMDNLSMSLSGIKHIIALSDKEGWIIDLRGTPDEFGGSNVGLCIGASWSECNIGNNGIGTCLALNQPVLVYGVEHYGTIYSSMACLGIPIFYIKEVIGALDISVPVEYAHPYRFYVLLTCVQAIEAELQNLKKNSNENLTDLNIATINEFIATAVHDLKNPLAVISGLSQLGNIITDNPTINDYFTRICKQVEEMNNMVIELLSIFKPVELLPRKIVPIIEEVLTSYKPICDSKNINLSFINKEDAIANLCDNLFKRAIENLINNAVQIMEEGGTIEVHTKVESNVIIILIKDTAGGIPEEIQQTVFEPFSFRRSGGTGLGLFMAYHAITNIHKGQIWYETEHDKGSTFYIKLEVSL